MSKRGQTERLKPFALSRERTLELIRVVAELVTSPEDLPRIPEGFLRPDMAKAMRRTTPDHKDLLATNRWHSWAADVELRNRGNFAKVLWACHELRAWRNEPEFSELGQPLSHALVRFGGRGDVPESAVERRQMVEAWTHPRQRTAVAA